MRRLKLRPTDSDIASWHRRLSPLTHQIIISGDLNEDPALAKAQLAEWQTAGITHILDTRDEWTDEKFVAEHAPDITYGWFGTHDDGTRQPDHWFDDGLAFALEALVSPNAVLLVHCHLGINRGPSMAYRILLGLRWNPAQALDTIRTARPIAGIRYADDALNHYRHANTLRRSRVLERRESEKGPGRECRPEWQLSTAHISPATQEGSTKVANDKCQTYRNRKSETPVRDWPKNLQRERYRTLTGHEPTNADMGMVLDPNLL